MWNDIKEQNCQSNTEKKKKKKKNKAEGIATSDFSQYLQSCSNQNRLMDQQNRIESPEVNPHLRSIFDKGGQNIKWRKDHLFRKWYWESWTTVYKSMKLDYTHIICKINTKQFKDLTIKYDTMNILEENLGKTFSDNMREMFPQVSQPRQQKLK